MKKYISTIISFAMVICCVAFIRTDVQAEEHDFNNLEEVLIVTDLDWSEYGARNVSLKYYPSSVTKIKTVDNSPRMELSYDLDNVGEIHFERIDDVGYFYIDNTLATIIIYNSHSNSRAISLPVALRSQPGNAASGFSSWYYWAVEDWYITNAKALAQSAILGAINSAIMGSLTMFTYIQRAYDYYSRASDMLTYFNLTASYYSDDLFAVTVVYNSQYSQCNILHWYGVEIIQFDDSSFTTYDIDDHFQKQASHYWYANPTYDYTQPDACRAVLNTYPI